MFLYLLDEYVIPQKNFPTIIQLPVTTFQESTRITNQHFPRRIQQTGKKVNPTRRCFVCSRKGKRRESVYWCELCGIGLCVTPCFEIYHTT